MITYIKTDIRRAFDHLWIANDNLLNTIAKLHIKAQKNDTDIIIAQKLNDKANKLLDARVKITEAIVLLSEANAI